MAVNYGFQPRNRAAAAGTPRQLVGEKWQKLQKLGNGCFGTVYLGEFPDGTKVAAKQIRLRVTDEERLLREMRQIAKEMAVLEKVTGEHRNIVRYFGCSFSSRSKSVYLLTQFIEGPTLHAYVRQLDGGMSEDEARGVTKQLLSALVFVHAKGVLHKDVKPDNVMIREADRVVKLIDFGIAGICGHRRDNLGPPLFSPPEVVDRRLPMSTKCDSFSLGLTLFFMVTGEHPLASLPPLVAHAALMNAEAPVPGLDAGRFSAEIRDFFARSTVKRPQDRASCSELLKSDFVTAGRSAQLDSWRLTQLMLVLKSIMAAKRTDRPAEYTVHKSDSDSDD